jgi:hypothetical protein
LISQVTEACITMKTEMYAIPLGGPGRAFIAPRPRGDDWIEDEVTAWRRAGVEVVVSLLEPPEIAELGLGQEEAQVRASGIEIISYPIPDRGIPASKETFSELISRLNVMLAKGKTILIHCRQGVGRSGLVAASLLLQAGLDAEQAIRRVSEFRGCPIPETPSQRQWIIDYGRVVSRSRSALPPLSALPKDAAARSHEIK